MTKEEKSAYLIALIKICEELASDNIDVNEAQKRADDLITGKNVETENQKSLWDKIVGVVSKYIFSQVMSLIGAFALLAAGFIPVIGNILGIILGIYDIVTFGSPLTVAFGILGVIGGLLGLAADIAQIAIGGPLGLMQAMLLAFVNKIPKLKEILNTVRQIFGLWPAFVPVLKTISSEFEIFSGVVGQVNPTTTMLEKNGRWSLIIRGRKY